MARCRALLLATIVSCITFGAALVPGADAAGPHRALVIVDTGSTTYQRVITFDQSSITGIQALQLAGADPVVYSFAGQGGAVCRLFGVGRDAGPSCLGGADGDNRYWAYFRAPAGTSSFTYSRTGGGATAVHDGDVEGWKFSTGDGPAWAPLPPVTTATTTAPPPPVAPPAPAAGGGTAPAGSEPGATSPGATRPPTAQELLMIAAARAAASTTTTTTRPEGSGAATEVQAARKQRTGERVAGGVLAGSGSDGGGSAGSLVLFAGVLAVLTGVALLFRRSRRRPVP